MPQKISEAKLGLVSATAIYPQTSSVRPNLVLIDTGDQPDNLMCHCIKVEVKIEILSRHFGLRPKL